MKVASSYFGEIDIDEGKIIYFESAIPGFDGIHKYFIITEDKEGESVDEENRLFCWLHSVEDADVAFALLDVFKVKADYQPEIEEKYLSEVKYADSDEIALYNIVNIPDNINDMTVNLMAPLVINFSKKMGMQVILSTDGYSLKHRIFDDIKKVSKEEEVNK